MNARCGQGNPEMVVRCASELRADYVMIASRLHADCILIPILVASRSQADSELQSLHPSFAKDRHLAAAKVRDDCVTSNQFLVRMRILTSHHHRIHVITAGDLVHENNGSIIITSGLLVGREAV